ncbi:BTAD domain-containing putative transcriptional regulator [Actinoplanes sp. NPDC048791]|uniref:ATP-binding protein n=1 Tax=Actinoplanes sp. NPDC048791 TaxID=3154623 RepID=UPI0033D7A721
MDIELTLLARVSHRGQEIAGARLGGLLALLAEDLRAGCSTARMADALWPDGQPEHPVKALQVLVTRARARLGPGVIVSTPAGYRLALGDDQVDASAVLLSAAASRRCTRDGDHAGALHHAQAGLALCAGATGWDIGSADPLAMLRAARLPTWRLLRRARALALARLGHHAEAAGPLHELAAERPRDEEILAQLLRGEMATHGLAAALSRYEAYRLAVRTELGSDPGPELRQVHRELLLADAPRVRRGVRHEPNPLLGRDEDIAAVAELLRTSRITSIVGAGGLGKTRLAQAVSMQASHRTVHFVELAGISTGGDVAGEVASALMAGEAPDPAGRGARRADLFTMIAEALVPGPALLVLDNCEHVVDAAAELAQSLVSAVPDLRVLTTSRSPLEVSAESVYQLRELDLPTTVELFRLRARAARPGIGLPPAAVERLCRFLDGLPLAVELAAARVRAMSVPELTDRLDDRFGLLRGNARDAPPRHRTLHAVVDWSWQLLEPSEQRAMRELSVFPGGFTALAARHLIGGDTVLERLVDQSLLRADDSGQGTRFGMAQTVREFSLGRRRAAGEDERVVDDFLGWARDFGVRHQQAAFASDFSSSVDEIRAEQDNLIEALRSAVNRGDGVTVAATAAVLGIMWFTESNFTRLAMLAEQVPPVLSRLRPESALVEAARTAAAFCALSAFLLRGPRPLRALVTLRRLPPPVPGTFVGAVQAALSAADADALSELCTSADPLTAAVANYALTSALEYANDLDGALRAARRMLDCLAEDSGGWIRAVAHARIGQFCLQVEPGEEAFRHLSAALSIVEKHGARGSASRARWAIVLANLQRGAFAEAEHGLEQLAPAGGAEELGLAMFDVCARAEILLSRGDVDGGLHLWRRAAEALRAGGPSGTGPWASEVRSVAVVVHARYGRLALVEDLTSTLPDLASATVASATVVDLPACGSLLLALAMVDLDDGATASGVRLIALADRLGWQRGFQPTMSPVRVREVARSADLPAYTDAVSSYAGLDHDGLRAAASAALRARPIHRTGSRRNSSRAHR